MSMGAGSRLAVALAASGTLVMGLPALSFVAGYGCGEGEDRLAEVMALEAVLGTAPEGAAQEDHYQECDNDDRFVVVGRRYQYDGSPKDALRHYGEAAQADSWRPRTTTGGRTVPGCFTKAMGDTTAYLGVESTDDGLLHVEIVADHAESPWC